MANKGFLNIRASVIEEHIVFVAVVAIRRGGRGRGGGEGRVGGRCHGMQNNKEVMPEIGLTSAKWASKL